MDEIKAWLNGSRDYDQGAMLYLQYGSDNLLKKIFREPASDFKKKKLVDALKGLLVSKVTREKKIVIDKDAAIEKVSISDRRWPANKDEITMALWMQWKPLFAELMSLTSRIYDVALAGEHDAAQKQEAGRMAHRILDLDDHCDDIYRKRDHYIKHGKLPEAEKPMELVVDPKKIPLALANCTRYIRDYKSKLRKQPEDVNAAAQIKKYEWAVGEYKRILNIE